MSGATTPARPVLATFTGRYTPGVVARVLRAVADTGADLVDLRQMLVRDHVTISLALAPAVGAGADDLELALAAAADRQDLTLTASREDPSAVASDGDHLYVCVIAAELSASALADIAGDIAGSGARIDRVRHLSRQPVASVEIDVSGADLDGLRRTLTVRAAELEVDVAVSPAGLARHGRRLVVLDVDSTLIQDEVIELLAAHAGRSEEVSALTEAAMRGEVDFETSLRQRVSALAGLHVDAVAEVVHEVRLTPGAKTLVDVLHHLGYTLALVSGGFVEVVGPLAASLGIRHVRANALEVSSGLLTGRTVGKVVGRAAKAEALAEFAAAEHLPLSRTVAIGDGANDLDMLAAAGLGIAFNAKPVLRAAAQATITVPFLDSVLHLLGLSRAEVEEVAAMAELDLVPLGTVADDAW